MSTLIAGTGLGLEGNLISLPGQTGATPQRGLISAWINAANGNLVLQNLDAILVGQGPDALALRTYNSQGRMDDDNGDNWRIGLFKSLGELQGQINAANSRLVRTTGDGGRQIYVYDSQRQLYVSSDPAGSDATLAWRGDGWVWSDGSASLQESYSWSNGSGRLLASRDQDGNSLTYSYTGTLLSSVRSASGECVLLDYQGQLLQQLRTLDGQGNTAVLTRYTYDALARLIEVRTDLSPKDSSIADGQFHSVRFTWDDSLGPSRRLAGMQQSDGVQAWFSWVQVDGQWRLASMRDALGNSTTLAYDSTQRTTLVTDALGNQVLLRMDEQGRLASMRSSNSGVVRELHWEWNARGELVRETDGLGNTIVYTYDERGNQVGRVDAAGTSLQRIFDAANRQLVEIVGSQEQALAVRRQAWDERGHLRYSVSAEGRVTQYLYNAAGQQTSVIQYLDARYPVHLLAARATLDTATLDAWLASQASDRTRTVRTDTSYDFRGQASSVTRYTRVDASGAGVRDGTQATTHFIYDAAGQLLSLVAHGGGGAAPGSQATSWVYDGLGRVVLTTDALGNQTLMQYDSAARSVRTTLANGMVRTAVHDQAGRLLSVSESDAGRLLGTTHYWYDALGHVRMQRDATGVRQHTFHDGEGRILATVDGDGSLVESVYDKAGRLVQTIAYAARLDATMLASLVDGSGNPVPASLADLRPATSPQDRVRWHFYDAAGRLRKTVDEEGYLIEREVDAAGRLVREIRRAVPIDTRALRSDLAPDASALSPLSAADDRVTRYFHDADGNLLATLDAECYLREFEYDGAGRLLHTVAYARRVDSAQAGQGSLAQLRPSAGLADAHSWEFYDGAGNHIASLDAEGWLTERQYSPGGLLVRTVRYANRALVQPGSVHSKMSLQALRPASSGADHVSLQGWDALNRLVRSAELPSGTITRYRYDAMGRLLQVDRAADSDDTRTQILRLDKQGNVLAELNGEGAAALLSRGATEEQSWNAWGQFYTLDAAGRRTSMRDAAGNRSLYYYDADGRLSHSINALGEVVENRYDAFGQLVLQRRYAQRLAPSSLSALQGGLADTGLLQLLTQLASGEDSVTTTAWTRRGQVAGVIDAEGHAVFSHYNGFNDLVLRQAPAGGDAGVSTSYAYDRRGMQVSVTEDTAGLRRMSQQELDAFGRTVAQVDGNGLRSRFTYDHLGRMIASIGAGGELQSSSWDAFGRIHSQTDALGHTTLTRWDDRARSMTVTTPEGVAVTTQFNHHGQVISVTDGMGRTSRLRYDRNGALVEQVDALGQARVSRYDPAGRLLQSIDALGTRTDFTYDAAGRVLTRRQDPDGLNLTTRYTWDAKGQEIEVVDPNGTVTRKRYDRKEQLLEVVLDPSGLALKTRYGHDAAGRITRITEAAGSSAERVTVITWDALGRRLSETVDPSGLAITTRYEWDAEGRLRSRTDANGNSTRYFYDAANRLAYTVDPLGGVTGNEYDAAGRLVKVTAYAMPVANAAGAADAQALKASLQTSDADRISITVYDKDGRALYSLDSLHQVTARVFDAAGHVVQQTIHAHPVTLPAQLDAQSMASAVAAIADASHDRSTRYVHDALGRLSHTISADGAVSALDYDANGNLLRTTAYARRIAASGIPDAADMQALLQPDAANDRVTRTVYDRANRAIFSIDAEGYVRQTQYDAGGRVASSIAHAKPVTVGGLPSAAAVLAALGEAAINATPTETISRDAAGRVTAITDALGNAERYTLDAMGNRLAIRDKNGGLWTYSFDAAGRKLTETSPALSVTTLGSNQQASSSMQRITTRYEWDALGNLLSRTEADGRPESRTTRYEYDALGRQVLTRYPTVAIYDAERDQIESNGLLRPATRVEKLTTPVSSVEYDRFGNATKGIDAAGNASWKVYDRLGRVVLEVDAEQFVTEYAYNAFGERLRVTRHVERLDFSRRSRPDAPLSHPEVASLLTTASGDRSIITEYDRMGRASTVVLPQAFVHDSSAAAGSQDFYAGNTSSSEYNAFGEVLRSSELVNPLNGKSAPTRYWYDRLGRRIAQVDSLGYLSTWEYDGAGNLLRQVEYATALDPSVGDSTALPRPVMTGPGNGQASEGGADRETRFEYDLANRKTRAIRAGVQFAVHGEGEELSSSKADAVTEYRYDALGRLVQVKDASGTSSYTWFDALGRVSATASPASHGYRLVSYGRDAHGNAVLETRHATALATADTTSFVAPAAHADDQTERRYFDSHGRLVHSVDAQGASRYNSWDVMGRIAKEWHGLTSIDGAVQQAIRAFRYDRLGQQVATVDLSLRPRQPAQWLGTTVNLVQTVSLSGGGLFRIPVRQTALHFGQDEVVGLTPQIFITSAAGVVSAPPAINKGNGQYSVDLNALATGNYSFLINYTRVGETTPAYYTRGVIYNMLANSTATVLAAAASDPVIEPPPVVQTVINQAQWNAFGEIVRKGVNGWQEYFDYNDAGQLWRTNAEDGVDRVYLYDLAGRETSEIRSQALPLKTIDDAASAAALGNAAMRTELVRDALGRVVSKALPSFTVQGNGQTPVWRQALDRWGNAVAFTDAAGNTSQRRYNDLNLLVQETGPQVEVWDDTGRMRLMSAQTVHYYDVLGREIGSKDANGNLSSRRLAADGQVLRETSADGGVTMNAWDVLGRKTSSTDALGRITTYAWDHKDRLMSVKRPNHQEAYAYDEDGNRILEDAADGKVLHWYDTQGRLVRSRLPLNQETSTWYDAHGNKIRQINANGDVTTWYADAFGRVWSRVDLGGATVTYSYNLAGLQTHAGSTRGQNIQTTYYENGLVKTVRDLATGGVTSYEYDRSLNRNREGYSKNGVVYQDNRIRFDALGRITRVQDLRYDMTLGYDAAGNRRFTRSSYIDSAGASRQVENWYRYDAMNRILVSQGVLRDEKIQLSDNQGLELWYDLAGNRKGARSLANGSETYEYDADNRLTATLRNGVVEAWRSYDERGRVTMQVSAASGANKRISKLAYNSNGWLISQDTYDAANVLQNSTVYTRYDRLGNVRDYRVSNYSGTAYTNYYSVSYAKFDSYREREVNGSSTWFQAGKTTTTLDVNGNAVAVSDLFMASKYREFVNDQAGHILSKTENGARQHYFYVNDRPMGSTGMGVGDFDFNYTPVSDHYPALTPGGYLVNQGDSLRSIALAVYGDAQLWYLIADANGLRTDAELVAGKRIVIPNQISNLHNSSDSFKPYNSQRIIGDTTPTLPDPPPPPVSSGGGCGGIGGLITAVVAIAVTVTTGVPLVAALGGGTAGLLAGSAVAGVLGGLASQVTGIALGIRQGLSFASMAMDGIANAVSMGLSGGVPRVDFASAARLAVSSSAISQGLGVITGLQQSFSWRALATAAVSGGFGATLGRSLGSSISGALKGAGQALEEFGERLGSGFVGGLAGSAVGGRGIDLGTVARDAFGNALGNSLARADWNTSAPESELHIPGWVLSEEDYWSEPAKTVANRYAETYGGWTFNTSDRLRVSPAPSPEEATDLEQVPSPEVRFAQEYMARHPDASLEEVQRAYDQAWAAQSDARLVREALEPKSDLNVAYPNESIRPLDPLEGFLTFNSLGRFIRGIGAASVDMASAVLETGRQVALSTGDAIRYASPGSNEPPRSTIGRLIYTQGVGSTALQVAGELMHGTVATALQPLNALYRGDAAMLGQSLPGAALVGTSFKALSAGRATSVGLDWSRMSARTGGNAADHVVQNHGSLSLTKMNQGVFYGNPISVVEQAWDKAQRLGVKPVTIGNRDIYVVPRPNAGYAGGMGGQLENFNHVTIITESGTGRVVTSYPSGGTPPLPKGYNFLLGGQ